MSEQIEQSVTKNDHRTGTFFFHFWGGENSTVLPFDLPEYTSHTRDVVMSTLLRRESNWAAAMSIASTHLASRQWRVSSNVKKYIRETQELLTHAQFTRGWIDFCVLVTQDYLQTDNGAFIEIIREDPSNFKSKIVGIAHLDSTRCTLSGEEDTPVWYEASDGFHRIPFWNVIHVSSMMNTSWTQYRGAGHCAATRCYGSIHKLFSLERLVRERCAGFRPQVLDLITGVTTDQVASAIAQAKAQAKGEGYAHFLSSALMGLMTDTPITHTRIPFADIPPGFDVEKERIDAQLQIANNVGIHPSELNPTAFITSSIGGNGQADIIARQTSGREIELLAERIASLLNWHVCNVQTVFSFVGRDLQDEKQLADIRQTNATAIATAVSAGSISPSDARQLLAHWSGGDFLPSEMLETDETQSSFVLSTEKAHEDQDHDQCA